MTRLCGTLILLNHNINKLIFNITRETVCECAQASK